jgi:uncharacterized protein YjiS (DUF1127 family)
MASLVHSDPTGERDAQALLFKSGDIAGLLLARATVPLRTLRRWWRRHQARQELLELDDHLLADIGITRGNAVREWQKAFWEG